MISTYWIGRFCSLTGKALAERPQKRRPKLHNLSVSTDRTQIDRSIERLLVIWLDVIMVRNTRVKQEETNCKLNCPELVGQATHQACARPLKLSGSEARRTNGGRAIGTPNMIIRRAQP